MPKRTSGRITDFDEKTITEILESQDLGRKLSKILDGNVRLALTAQKLLYRKMIDSGGSLNATQLNMIVGTASDKVTAMLKQVEVLRARRPDTRSRILEDSWKAGLANRANPRRMGEIMKPGTEPRDVNNLLQDSSLANVIRGLIQDNLRLAVCAHDILMERLEQELDSLEHAELERVCGVAFPEPGTTGRDG